VGDAGDMGGRATEKNKGGTFSGGNAPTDFPALSEVGWVNESNLG